MSKYKAYVQFESEKQDRNYLVPNACFNCCNVFRKPRTKEKRVCPKCGGEMVALNRKFSAPKSTDKKQWTKIKFLVEHGFLFHSVYEKRENGAHYKVPYPETIEEAKAFVVQYSEQAIKQNI